MRETWRHKRLKMWMDDPHCYWCGRFTHLSASGESVTYDFTATIDHVYSKWHHLHGSAPEGASEILVLACGQCNGDRAIIAQTLYLLAKRRVTAQVVQTARLVRMADAFANARRPPSRKAVDRQWRREWAEKYANAPSTVYALMIAERGKYVRERYVFE